MYTSHLTVQTLGAVKIRTYRSTLLNDISVHCVYLEAIILILKESQVLLLVVTECQLGKLICLEKQYQEVVKLIDNPIKQGHLLLINTVHYVFNQLSLRFS